jgi:hypothetical protein
MKIKYTFTESKGFILSGDDDPLIYIKLEDDTLYHCSPSVVTKSSYRFKYQNKFGPHSDEEIYV